MALVVDGGRYVGGGSGAFVVITFGTGLGGKYVGFGVGAGVVGKKNGTIGRG